jgi:hypothetical protein
VNDVELAFKGLCKDRPASNKDEGQSKIAPSGFDNSMPQIINPVDKLNVMAGELLQYQVKYIPNVYLNIFQTILLC